MVATASGCTCIEYMCHRVLVSHAAHMHLNPSPLSCNQQTLSLQGDQVSNNDVQHFQYQVPTCLAPPLSMTSRSHLAKACRHAAANT
jgi:hypothetical protein